MHTTIRFKIRKEVDALTARKILKLKGGLVASSYTDIIHFDDEEEEFYIHYFQVPDVKRSEAESFIKEFTEANSIRDIIIVI